MYTKHIQALLNVKTAVPRKTGQTCIGYQHYPDEGNCAVLAEVDQGTSTVQVSYSVDEVEGSAQN